VNTDALAALEDALVNAFKRNTEMIEPPNAVALDVPGLLEDLAQQGYVIVSKAEGR
jgi:hypothetical protein